MNDKIEWVLVPRECTQAMELALSDALATGDYSIAECLDRANAAAPKPEAQAAGVDGVIGQLQGTLRFAKGYHKTATWRRKAEWEVIIAQLLSAIAALSTPASHDAQQPSAPVGAKGPHGFIHWLDEGYEIEWLREWRGGNCHIYLAQQPAVAGDGVPLRVFSAGGWTYDGTGQTFSHEDMDEAAFVAYRDHTALTPAATPGDDGDWYVDPNSGSYCVDLETDAGQRMLSLLLKPNGQVSFAAYMRGQKINGDAACDGFWEALATLASAAPAQKEGNGNG